MSTEHNFAARFFEHARVRPHQDALIVETGGRDSFGERALERRTFAQLTERAAAYARGLREVAGIERGEKVLLLVKPSLEFFEVAIALYAIGAVPVLIDPGMGLPGFLRCVAQNQPTAMLAIPAGQLLSRVYRSAFASVRKRVTVGPALFGGVSLSRCFRPGPAEIEPVQADDTVAILFTSGSTGTAKGVRYSHRMLSTQADFIGALYDIRPGEVDVPCFLPFAIFSVGLGMTVALPSIDFSRPAQADVRAVQRAVLRHEAVQLVGSPTLLRRLVQDCQERGLRLPTVRRVLTFGAPIPEQLHRGLAAVLGPWSEVFTPYGATEALPVASIAASEILAGTAEETAAGAGTCVGRVVPDTEVAIVAIHEEPIPRWDDSLRLARGQVGEICVKGAQVSPEYMGLPDDNAVSKIADEGGFWHRMGDVGYIDGAGRLWFCGRKSHRVRLADGGTLFPDMAEGVFNTHPAVARSAVVGVRGQAVLIVEAAPDEALRAALLQMAAKLELTRPVARVLFHASLPVDRRHNAKIDRPALAHWAESQI